MIYTLLYRGSLDFCNYICAYCPFSKNKVNEAKLNKDKQELTQFIKWLKKQKKKFKIFFTPYGEGLIYPFYQKALIELSHLKNIKQVVMQTNLSGNLSWVSKLNSKKLILWATYHPTQVKMNKFLQQIYFLNEKKIYFSVGVVGKKEFKKEIKAIKSKLPARTLWVNAFKHVNNYYSKDDIQFFSEIDPHFTTNLKNHPSFRKSCKTGESVFTVYGNGNLKRCHFVDETLGNIYESNFNHFISQKPCPNQTCHCYIGYVFLNELKLNQIYGKKLLGRLIIKKEFKSLI